MPDFSSQGTEMEYFKCAHPSKWDFESYKEHLAQGKTRQPNLRLLVTKYKHGLQLMKRFGDLSQEHMEIIDELIDNCISLVSFLKVSMSFDFDNVHRTHYRNHHQDHQHHHRKQFTIHTMRDQLVFLAKQTVVAYR